MDKKIEILNNCIRYAGINQQTTKEDYIFLMEFFESQFSNISYMELQEAFKLNAKKQEIEAYQNFSPMLIGKVINAYKEEKRKKNMIKKIEPAKMLENKIDPDKSNKEDFEVIERRFKQGLPIDGFNFSGAFLHLEKEGLINLTKEDKIKLKEKVESRLKSKINEKRINLMRVPFDLLNSIRPSSIKIECRKSVVIDYLEKL